MPKVRGSLKLAYSPSVEMFDGSRRCHMLLVEQVARPQRDGELGVPPEVDVADGDAAVHDEGGIRLGRELVEGLGGLRVVGVQVQRGAGAVPIGTEYSRARRSRCCAA